MIYLLTSDGYRDSIELNYYAYDKPSIKRMLRKHMKYHYNITVKDILINIDTKKIYFKERFYHDDYWEQRTYNLISIKSIDEFE